MIVPFLLIRDDGGGSDTRSAPEQIELTITRKEKNRLPSSLLPDSLDVDKHWAEYINAPSVEFEASYYDNNQYFYAFYGVSLEIRNRPIPFTQYKVTIDNHEYIVKTDSSAQNVATHGRADENEKRFACFSL